VEVVAMGPGLEYEELKTDAEGRIALKKSSDGRYAFRAKFVEERTGTANDKEYGSVRHYATLAVSVGKSGERTAAETAYPPLDVPVTSFGAAVSDGKLYVYGGHSGAAHSYSNPEQGRELLQLSLTKPGGWQPVAEGPPLQGLAMVAHGGKLYRLGGFTAKNAEGEESDLWSQSDAASFDPKDGRWQDLPSLPEPRSSFDAAVLGDTIYVIGGWQLSGPGENHWHETAWSLDLSATKPEWKPLPPPPFQRRALSVAAFENKIYAIGGMQETGGPTTRVDVYDPQSGKWSQGPSLVGEKPLAGFGSSAFAVGDGLYVSTIEGKLQRLSDDDSAWEPVRQLERARFFHRMLPLDDHRLVFVGGASMEVGKFEEVDVVDVNQTESR
jgi:N-acetylneuraminic acid mutarotase